MGTLKTRRPIDTESKILHESRHWVENNEGFKLKENDAYYPSPRISSEVMDCSMPMTFDHYSFCSLGCMYCFAYFFKSNNSTGNDMLKTVNVDGLIRALYGEPKDSRQRMMHKYFYSKKFLLHWGGMADPFCNFEHTNRRGLPLIKALGDLNYPCLFSFKGKVLLEDEYMNLFAQYSSQHNFAFQISMVTHDDHLASMVEMGVPSPSMRLRAMRTLSDMGYWTILRLRPFIIGITDESLDELLHAALEAGIKAVSTEFFALDVRANVGMRTRYDWLAKLIGVKDLMQYFKELSPRERGGYMRLNRLVKEPFVRKIYEFCARHNLTLGVSDPDFKELCTSGSCCGMPDVYTPNPLLQNWSKNQMTYHLKNLRKHYHLTGECSTLRFDEAYGSDAEYLDDLKMTNDHVAVTSMCAADRRVRTFRLILQDEWNNLRSPGNPRNYFHGKLMPINVDDNGNYVYVYNPSDYEDRWTQEGISLTR